MKDPFARAHTMVRPMGAATPATQPPAATAAPMSKGMPAPQNPTATQDNFLKLAQQSGLGHIRFAKDPMIARTQLMHHLQQKYGSGYADNPEAKQLLASFNTHQGGSNVTKEGMESGAAASMKHLMGRM